MESFLTELNRFLCKATLSTYAGGGPEADFVQGFTELEYDEGEWAYKDSYTGFFRSWGRETIWHRGKPFWTQLYGGGMAAKFHSNKEFALKTFEFLRKALSCGEKRKAFQPRGPKKFSSGTWKYICNWNGTISKFEGSEKILFKRDVVFTHAFLGGLI